MKIDTRFSKQFKRLERENKPVFDESKRHVETWAKSRAELNESMKTNNECVQYIYNFSQVCLVFKQFMIENMPIYRTYNIPFEPMLKQINNDLKYVIAERERRLKLKDLGPKK